MSSHDLACYGTAVCHHGEFMQGCFLDDESRSLPALVTVPCPLYRSRARFVPLPNRPFTVYPADRVKARRAVELFLEATGHAPGGILEIESDVPLGWGMGSSTSDVVAAIRAAAQACAVELAPEVIAGIAVRAEQASDSIMFDEVVLFASRHGEILERFGDPLPVIDVLGFSTCPASPAVQTEALSVPRYTAAEIALFADLRRCLRLAISRQDARLIGEISTESARVSQRYLPKPCFEELLDGISRTGAMGIEVSHSGSVAGFLFDEAGARDGIDRAQTLVGHLGLGPGWTFRIGAAMARGAV